MTAIPIDMRVAEFIKAARERKGLSQAEVARQLDVTRTTIYQWEKGIALPKRVHAIQLAGVLGVPVSTLAGDPTSANVRLVDSNEAFRYVPVIDWCDAGLGAAALPPYPRGEDVEYLRVTFPVSKDAFALEIENTSMFPEFKQGDIVVIDPDITPEGEDNILVQTKPDECVFAGYQPRGVDSKGEPVFDLVFQNPDYPTIPVNAKSPGRILGTLIEHRRRFRR